MEIYSPTLMHSHFGPRVFYDLEVSEKFKIPLVGSFYGVDATMLPTKDPSWKDRYLEVYQRASLIVVEANSMKRLMIDLGCPPDKIVINHLGVDLSSTLFKCRSKKDPLKFLIASSFREKKGIPDALESLGRIKNKLPSFTITIIGGVGGASEEIAEEKKIKDVNYGKS